MSSFDLIFPGDAELSPFLLAAEKKKIAPLGRLTIEDEPFAGKLSILSTDGEEPALCFFRFPYGNRIWNLSRPDELSALLLLMKREGDDFLSTYRALCKAKIDESSCRFAFGLEAFGSGFGEGYSSPACRKTLLDLTDRILKKNMILGYATKHSIFDLSPCVLRRFAELRGDLLPASFASDARKVGKGLQDSLLAARAAGIGSYMTYQNANWERYPITTFKEIP